MGSFDLAGVLRRIRRNADLSQRQLATAAGLSASAVGHAEAGTRDLPVGALTRAAALAGLRLAVLDGQGREVPAMSADAVSDLGGRRFPAHLDTRTSDGGDSLYEPRRDRPETAHTFTRDRQSRDWARRASGTPADHHPYRPGDSPWERKAARRRAAWQRRDDEHRRRLEAGELPPLEDFDCTCPPECDALDDRSGRPVHAEECPCSCDVA